MRLIAPENHLAVMGLLFAVVGFALWAERYAWGRRVTAPLLVIAIPLVLSNLGLIPRAAPAYDFVSGYFVAVAIPLLLFKADLRRIFAETGRTLLAFLVAAAGTMIGAALAVLLVPVGDDAAAVAAVHTGGYIGGGMNFVAVGQAIGLTERASRFATVLGAEATVGLTYLMALSVVPTTGWFRRWAARDAASGHGEATRAHAVRASAAAADGTPAPVRDDVAASGSPAHGAERSGGGIADLGPTVRDQAVALGLSLVICAAGNALAAAVGYPAYGILGITLLAVLAANAAPAALARLRGDVALGMLLMYAFFAVFGAGTDVGSVVRDAPLLLLFAATMVVTHFAVAFGGGRLLGLGAREVTIASNACLLGPPTAAAQAAQEGWSDLVTPGVLCGVFGYVIGNFLGVTVYALLS